MVGSNIFGVRHGPWSEGKGLEDLERVMTSLAALVPWDCVFCFLFLVLTCLFIRCHTRTSQSVECLNFFVLLVAALSSIVSDSRRP